MMQIASLGCKTNRRERWREMEVSGKKEERRRVRKNRGKKDREGSENKNPEGRGVKEMGSIKKEKHLQRRSSEQTACDQRLNHGRRLTLSPLEVNCSHSAWEHSSKHQQRASPFTHTHTHTDRDTHTHTQTQTHRQRHTHTETQTETHTHTDRDTHTETQTHTHTETHTHRDTNTRTHTHTHPA